MMPPQPLTASINIARMAGGDSRANIEATVGRVKYSTLI